MRSNLHKSRRNIITTNDYYAEGWRGGKKIQVKNVSEIKLKGENYLKNNLINALTIFLATTFVPRISRNLEFEI